MSRSVSVCAGAVHAYGSCLGVILYRSSHHDDDDDDDDEDDDDRVSP